MGHVHRSLHYKATCTACELWNQTAWPMTSDAPTFLLKYLIFLSLYLLICKGNNNSVFAWKSLRGLGYIKCIKCLHEFLSCRMCSISNLITSSYYCCEQNIPCGKRKEILLLVIEEDFLKEERLIRAQKGGISVREEGGVIPSSGNITCKNTETWGRQGVCWER